MSDRQKGEVGPTGEDHTYKYEECVCPHVCHWGGPSGDGLREHLRTPSLIYQYSQSTGHCINVDCLSIVGMKVPSVTRDLKEAMLI